MFGWLQGINFLMTIAYIEAQGSLLHVRIKGQPGRKNQAGGSRGVVTGFSKKSRHRLLIFMSRLKTKGCRGTFLTLTMSECFDATEAKRALKRFLMRIRRHYESVSGIWRMERQETGRVHFHLLLFQLPFIPQSVVQKVWTRCTREARSIVDIRLASGHRRVLSYISKYISKPDERDDLTSLEDVPYQHATDEPPDGRVWGWINKKSLPLGERIEGFLTSWSVIKFVRFEANYLSRGRASQSIWRVTLFSNQNYTLLCEAMAMGGLSVQEFKDSSFAPSWEELNPEMAIRYSTALNR